MKRVKKTKSHQEAKSGVDLSFLAASTCTRLALSSFLLVNAIASITESTRVGVIGELNEAADGKSEAARPLEQSTAEGWRDKKEEEEEEEEDRTSGPRVVGTAAGK
jgi:hypothetical protein